MLEEKLDLNKIVTYALILVLGASEGWQYFDFQDKIHRDTEEVSAEIYDSRVDSLIKVLNGRDYAQGLMEAGAMEFKNLPHEEAREYMMKVFKVADEAIANDSSWRYEQQPFLLYLMEHKSELDHLFKYRYLTPMEDRATNKLHFNWTDGVYPVASRRTNNAFIRSWRDSNDDNHIIQDISVVKDR